MDKRNVLINVLLVMVFIALVLGAVFFKMKIDIKEENAEKVDEKIVLKDVIYDSAVSQVGYGEVEPILRNFVDAYNNKNGEQLAQMMNLVATYIYSECENESEFDKKYVEKLSTDLEAQELLLMQYSLQREEKGIISGVENSDVELTLIENSEITDTSEYLSKMTANIRTVSKTDNVDEVDTLEFLLLHRDGAYYIIKYDLKDSVPYTE